MSTKKHITKDITVTYVVIVQIIVQDLLSHPFHQFK